MIRSAGRKSAYVEAVEQHYERIYALLHRFSHDAELAADLTQDTFANAWRSIDQFQGRSSLGTWLYRIALNTYRSYARRTRLESELPEDDESVSLPDIAPELIESLAAEELQAKVQQAVDQLPEIYREAVILRCYHGLKYREVAEALDVPIGTVQHRLHIALAKLRASLGEEVAGYETAVV